MSKVNLALPSVQIREIRINSITGYHGDAEDLVAASACGLKDVICPTCHNMLDRLLL